ncbi:MAG: hypothetical protein CM1200mP30_09360 [Pseudomonadota bacterium]|nr:MAG: hypothetical protein CM1200mP30_09360 [Pseudomonadota bacterium]
MIKIISKIALSASFILILGHTTMLAGNFWRFSKNFGKDFPAIPAVLSAAEKCAGGGVTFTKNTTKSIET